MTHKSECAPRSFPVYVHIRVVNGYLAGTWRLLWRLEDGIEQREKVNLYMTNESGMCGLVYTACSKANKIAVCILYKRENQADRATINESCFLQVQCPVPFKGG